MNTIRFNINRAALCVLFFVVSAQAVDENQLKNKTPVALGSKAESVPVGYVEHILKCIGNEPELSWKRALSLKYVCPASQEDLRLAFF